ncbi:MAG: cytochrome c, partial [Planctomycetota bacterium]
RFTQGLEAGINRLSWGPDNALYVGGIGSTGNWGHQGKKHFGLQRLKHNGETAFEMLSIHARENGFVVEFTEPLHEDWGHDPLAWQIERWWYEPTEEYGGAKQDEEYLNVLSVNRSEDGRRVFIELDGLREEHVIYFRILHPFVSESGNTLWTTEAWYTLNQIPSASVVVQSEQHNELTEAERSEGWELLFDGEQLDSWTSFKSDTLSEGWQAQNGELVRAGSAGDIVTRESYRDFELALDWRITHKGNSGIFFHVTDDLNYVWESGPEMQILDNDGHGDGINEMTSTGANYALHAPASDVTRPLGQFNEARLRVKDGKVTHWLNGVKLLEYELGSEDWKARLAVSKFASMPGYGIAGEGRIALQDHGDPVFFRNLKIRRL